jgi:hypothetical protein
MHLVGRASTLDLWHGDRRRNLFTQHGYDYNAPRRYDLSADQIILERGDWLQTTCSFDSRTRTNYTRFGEATQDEMCLAFILYYPASDITKCISTDEHYLASTLRGEGELDAYVALPPDIRAMVGPTKGLCGPAGVLNTTTAQDATAAQVGAPLQVASPQLGLPSQAPISASAPVVKVAVSAAATASSSVCVAWLIGSTLCVASTTRFGR